MDLAQYQNESSGPEDSHFDPASLGILKKNSISGIVPGATNDIHRIIDNLKLLASDPSTAIKNEHIHDLVNDILSGRLPLHGEELDIIAHDARGQERVIAAIDRRIAHIYFAADGSYARERSAIPGAQQLLHRTSVCLLEMPSGEYAFIRWTAKDRVNRQIGLIGGHVASGSSYAETIEKEIVEELDLERILGVGYHVSKKVHSIGVDGGLQSLGPGRQEVTSVYKYSASSSEAQAIYQLKVELDSERQALGDKAFYRKLRKLEKMNPGHGEIWEVVLFSKHELRDKSYLKAQNVSQGVLECLGQAEVQKAIL